MRQFLLALLSIALLAAEALPAAAQTFLPFGRVERASRAGLSLDSLPAGLGAEPGALSVIADFDALQDGEVPVYVVNRTEEEAAFAAQESNLYLFPEVLLPGGEWRRVQPYQAAWCGNSYMGLPALPPETFWRTSCWIGDGEVLAWVRFRSRENELVSNVGAVPVDLGRMDEASRDDYVLWRGSRRELRALARDERVPTDRRWRALLELANRRVPDVEGEPQSELSPWEDEDTRLCAALLAHSTTELRAQALSVLARRAPLELAPARVQPLLRDPQGAVRAAAVELLGRCGALSGERSLQPVAVRAVVADTDRSVRHAFARHASSLVPDLDEAERLLRGLAVDIEPSVRKAARQALLGLGLGVDRRIRTTPVDLRSLDRVALRALAGDPCRALDQRVVALGRLRRHLPGELGQGPNEILGPEDERLAREESLSPHPELRAEAVELLAACGSREGSWIRRACEDPDARVRAAGLDAAVRLRSRREACALTAVRLRELARDPDARVRRALATGLDRLDLDPLLAQELKACLEVDRDPLVRRLVQRLARRS